MSDDASGHELLSFAVGIVSAHVAYNGGPADGLPNLIRSVFDALNAAGTTPVIDARAKPFVPVKRSVFPDYIICLEDGKRLKMLKRHLRTVYGLTPESYRIRWDLPATYPMVAPNYAKQRSSLAKSFGLGRKLESVAAVEVLKQRIPLSTTGRKPGRPKRVIEQKLTIDGI